MNFELIRNGRAADIYLEENTYPGVLRVAKALAEDIYLVTGIRPAIIRDAALLSGNAIIIGTVGRTALFNKLSGSEEIIGKREVFELRYAENPYPGVEKALVVFGSDKRGTIYGSFEISRLLGVSPWVWFADALPKHIDAPVFGEEVPRISKEPSIRYRGFFINDEWPSFGNWTNNLFGGFNANMYEQVFLLLLRMRGNYLWPAMWSAIFPNDGPGIENARLADELGVVMGASHHEPCCRQGEEYRYLRGKDSIYGDAWNFNTNEEGITRFWADGLKRSGRFENVITVGMRGEADSAILGREATLKDNIDLLRRVLKTQNRLIREYVNADLDSVPRMLALYKEVEPYFYGTADTPGLMGDAELEGVTLMLCEDNFGNMRTLPTEQMRKHRGGYGMYYHFDYHGGPVSYEWVNSTQIAKVWEQMGRAYESGIRDIWIVNVGDLKPQEFPLTYFLDLAYDFETYGARPNETEAYTKDFAEKTFAGAFDEECFAEAVVRIANTLTTYSTLNAMRRPEHLHPGDYSLCEDDEAARMLAICRQLRENSAWLTAHVKPSGEACLFELITYPAEASANLVEMMIYADANEALLAKGDTVADRYARLTEERIAEDAALVERYHAINGGKWNGMMSGKHIGFVSWNDENSAPPAVHYLKEVESGEYTPKQSGGTFAETMLASIDTEFGKRRPAWAEGKSFPANTYLMQEPGVISIDVADYVHKSAKDGAAYELLTGYGRSGDALAVLPVGRYYHGDGPTVTYRIAVPKTEDYTLRFCFAPSNPRELNGSVCFGLKVDDGDEAVYDIIPEGFRSGDCFNGHWNQGVMINVREKLVPVRLSEGTHTLTICSVDAEAVLERIVVTNSIYGAPKSYFGPRTTYKE